MLILIFTTSLLTFSVLLLTLLFSRWPSQVTLLDNYAAISPLEIFEDLAGVSTGTLSFFLTSYTCQALFLTFLEQKKQLTDLGPFRYDKTTNSNQLYLVTHLLSDFYFAFSCFSNR